MTPLQLEIQLKNYRDYPNDKALSALIQTLGSLPLATINDFCLQNETVKILLGQPDFFPFWRAKMAGIKVKGLADFRFKATDSLNPMEITLGYFNYLQSLRFPEHATKFTHQALSFHSFHALETFSRKLIINKEEDSSALIISALSFFEQEAVWHGTPAYLLIAKLYFGLALALTHENAYSASAAYQMVLKNLEFARLFESDSANDLSNAYFGQSLAKNNPFHQPTIEAIRKDCIKHAGSYLHLSEISSATHSARLSQPRRMNTAALAPANLSDLHQAILMDSVNTLRVVFKQDELESKNAWGETPLLFAIRHNKMESVRCLLSLGANPGQADAKGVNAFRLALETGQPGIGRLLLQYAPALINNALPTTEHVASKTLDSLKKIPTESELISFAQALQNNDTLTIRALLEKGLNPNLILSSGKTALAQLFTTEDSEGIELLLNYGVSLSQQDAQGETILFSLMKTATFQERGDVKYYFHHFIALGADINAQNKRGETPLIQAVKRADIKAVSFLVQQDNIDLTKQTKEGLSALDYAKKSQCPSLVSLLKEQGLKALQEQKPQSQHATTYKKLNFFGLGASYPSASTEQTIPSQINFVK